MDNLEGRQMSKYFALFWEGFWEGFFNMFAWTSPIAFVIMLLLYYFHPYERCERMYEDYNDVMECVWILTHE